MNTGDELLALKNNYTKSLNEAVDYIAVMKYTRPEALRHLNQNLLSEAGFYIDSQLKYLDNNLTGKADERFFRFSMDFIENFKSPYPVEQYKSAEFEDLEVKWFTELNRVLSDHVENLVIRAVHVSLLSGLALYSTEKNVSESIFNTLCDRLPLPGYILGLEEFASDTDSPSWEYLHEVFDNDADMMDSDEDDPLCDEFYTWFENLQIPLPGLSDKAVDSINQSVNDYILGHLDSYPDEAMIILNNSLTEDGINETVEFIADIERKKRNELLLVEEKYAAEFASGILKRTGYPDGFTQETVEQLDMVRTAKTFVSCNPGQAALLFMEACPGDCEDPVMLDIRNGVFFFTDFSRLTDRNIQKILREISFHELAIAFQGTSPAMLDALYRNMSERAALQVKEYMDFNCKNNDTSGEEVKRCRKAIRDVANKLLHAGEIYLEFGYNENN